MNANVARGLAAAAIAVATIVVIVALAVSLFFNPLYVGFEQGRTGADTWTGYSMDEVHAVTDEVLRELYLGPPAFAMTVGGQPVFDPRERAHLVDVRTVLLGLVGVTLLAIVVLLVAWRSRPPRGWAWRGIAAGSGVLVGAVVVLGAFFAVDFNTAFDVFHRLFFGAGTYTFDPRTERLVQLFPEEFWFETSLFFAAVLLVLGLAVLTLALRRLSDAGAASSQPLSAASPESASESNP